MLFGKYIAYILTPYDRHFSYKATIIQLFHHKSPNIRTRNTKIHFCISKSNLDFTGTRNIFRSHKADNRPIQTKCLDSFRNRNHLPLCLREQKHRQNTGLYGHK